MNLQSIWCKGCNVKIILLENITMLLRIRDKKSTFVNTESILIKIEKLYHGKTLCNRD